MRHIADRIRQRRGELGLSQHDLARRVGDAHPITISRWERGVSRPSSDVVVRLADALEVEVRWLLEDDAPATGTDG